MGALFQEVLTWYMDHITYWTVFLLMAVESTIIPFPSELVIPPAAYKAANGDMNILLIIIAGSLGAVAGSLINYFAAKLIGRKLLLKFVNTRLANLMMVNQAGIEKSENYFLKNGKTSTLIGRLIPGVRHLISIPAGLATMNLRDFIVYTAIGATAWNVILAMLGYFFYSQKVMLDKYYKEVIVIILIGLAIYILNLIYKGLKKTVA
jgi:membrane protein DedA with SNARE-associated domain